MKRLTCLITLFVICLIGCSETTDHEEQNSPPQVTTPLTRNPLPPVNDSPQGFGVTVERNNPAAVDEKDLDE